MKKVLLVSSQGGHWIQLKRLLPAFDTNEIVFISTFEHRPVVSREDVDYYSVCDASRWNKLKLLKQAYQVSRLVNKIKPDVVITTGASIGIWAILRGRLLGANTIWIDSIANYDKISLSGTIAKYFANHHITQWEHLSNSKTKFKGSVI